MRVKGPQNYISHGLLVMDEVSRVVHTIDGDKITRLATPLCELLPSFHLHINFCMLDQLRNSLIQVTIVNCKDCQIKFQNWT